MSEDDERPIHVRLLVRQGARGANVKELFKECGGEEILSEALAPLVDLVEAMIPVLRAIHEDSKLAITVAVSSYDPQPAVRLEWWRAPEEGDLQ